MAVAVNSETGYERQNLPEPTDCLWILQPSHVTRSHKNANVKRYAVATLPRTDGVIAHKWHTTRTGKPGRSAQTYFSFPSPAPLPNAHAHEEKLRLACETRNCYGHLALNLYKLKYQFSLSYSIQFDFYQHQSEEHIEN